MSGKPLAMFMTTYQSSKENAMNRNEGDSRRDSHRTHSLPRKSAHITTYNNDDYTKYGGPEYSDGQFEIGEEEYGVDDNRARFADPYSSRPGISGNNQDQESEFTDKQKGQAPSHFSDEWSNDNRSEASHEPNHWGKGPKGYTRSDERIQEEVCEMLTQSYTIDATNILVEVRAGRVFLRGSVDDQASRRKAGKMIKQLIGVR